MPQDGHAAPVTRKMRWHARLYQGLLASVAQHITRNLMPELSLQLDKHAEHLAQMMAAQTHLGETDLNAALSGLETSLHGAIAAQAERSVAVQTVQTDRLAQMITRERRRYAANFDVAFSQLEKSLRAAIAAQGQDDTSAWHSTLHQVMTDHNARLLEALHGTMAHVDGHLSAHITKQLTLQNTLSGMPLRTDPTLLQQRVLAIGRHLMPMTAMGIEKCRVGHTEDGGYVMLDDFERNSFALSFGIGQEISWDLQIASRGLDVHQFDHTIDHLPETDPRLHFHRVKIGSGSGSGEASLASARNYGGDGLCIVKIDIEGDEWNVLHAAGTDDFSCVTQLICEFHDFDRVGDADWFNRAEATLSLLAKEFHVVHVHANNHGALQVHGNISFPEILEVTFANKAFFDFSASHEVFPTALDYPNRPDMPDIFLGPFHF